MDIEPGPRVDLVGVAEELPIQDGVIDGVILQAVLEHVARRTTGAIPSLACGTNTTPRPRGHRRWCRNGPCQWVRMSRVGIPGDPAVRSQSASLLHDSHVDTSVLLAIEMA